MYSLKVSLIFLVANVGAFQPVPQHTRNLPTQLYMGKKIRNKQADLAKKMALAKEKKSEKEDSDTSSDDASNKKIADKEIKEINDRKRFEELLKSSSVSLREISSDGYLNKEQEEAEIDALRKGIDLLFEGDPAPTTSFEDIITSNDNALGENGTKRLLPWLRSSSDYLIVVCDPRVQSPPLRDTMKSLANELPKTLLSRTIVINADTAAENRRFAKKAGVADSLQIFSDEKRRWMQSYTALGEDRWTMTMFVLADERLQKIARDVDALSATKTIQNAVKAMENRRL